MKSGGYRRPFVGLSVCGDSFLFEESADGDFLAAVIDGLGHGPESAAASERAVEVIRESTHLTASAIVLRCHQELRSTRGAAMGLLKVDAQGRGEFCGIGNVEVQSLAGRPPSVFCLAGIVGHNLRVARPMPVRMEPGDIYCLMSDGISTRANLKSCLPGLPEHVARRIVEQWGRPHDDASALIVGFGANPLLEEAPPS
jgi:hypothetical protein